MKTKFTVMLLTLTGLMILAGQVRGVSSAAPGDKYVNHDYKGGSTFNLVSAGPNVAGSVAANAIHVIIPSSVHSTLSGNHTLETT
jgi:hypothetical protein